MFLESKDDFKVYFTLLIKSTFIQLFKNTWGEWQRKYAKVKLEKVFLVL